MVLSSDAIVIEGPKTTGNSPLFLDQVSCVGDEHHFNECNHETPEITGCTRAAVACITISS